tara:strand:+ start:23 stop:421 length:399 start_codon:yes stop_codon:yes gene_type:complete
MAEYKGKKIERGSSRGRSSKVFKAPKTEKLPSESEVEQAKQQQDMKEGNYLKIVDYEKDKAENKEFDETLDSVSPEGKYQRSTLDNLKEGVRIRNRNNLSIKQIINNTGYALGGAASLMIKSMLNPRLSGGI